MTQNTSFYASIQSSPPDPIALQKAVRQEIITLLLALFSIALMVAPWIVGEADTAKDAHRNELGVAIVVFLIAITRFMRYPGARSDLLVLVAGAWLAASPYVLSLQKTAVFDGAQIVDMVIGGIYVLLALLSLLLLKRTEGHRDHNAQATTRDRG
ncbi:SPW repeat domain-containing protein [Streptomyces rishiriensis]|uniref:SPW repeat-containing integral membrane domain-containing protein n=1 Tax=Streptomyces rishiriensis TaxID=68264 RepID=A0ABU0P2Y1_STRRH|nr:SPW repeat protein [Streptomyces rishiriensis]MDQ0585719.1 hypothetical protein [Streptomyces rishiriensis]